MAIEPTLTPQEKGLLTAVTNRIRAAQELVASSGGRCIQARSGKDDEFAAVGVTKTQMTTARAAGVTADVDEYEGPQGVGWQLRIRLVRGGVTWERIIHSGPETWREQAWRVVPEMT